MPDPNADKANLQQGQTLEGLLMAKNRKLLEDLTKIRARGSLWLRPQIKSEYFEHRLLIQSSSHRSKPSQKKSFIPGQNWKNKPL
jgi:hypothetical protein